MDAAHIVLAPGFFGFDRLAGLSYFHHVEAGLRERFAARGREVEIHVADLHPSASLRRRAARLAQRIAETAGNGDGPIHLLGHSTGGLDARLVAAPGVRLEEGVPGAPAGTPLLGAGTGVPASASGTASNEAASTRREAPWLPRLRSVTTLNAPHYGTPLAAFFATAQGQRLLYAASTVTVAALTLGSPPLAATSALVGALGRSRTGAGLVGELIERVVEAVAGTLDEVSSAKLRAWLWQVREDQGAVVQLTPESMDLVRLLLPGRPGVRYQCVASWAPPRRRRDLVLRAGSPTTVVTGALFRLLQRATERPHPLYPCAAPDADSVLRAHLGEPPPDTASDGIVPLRSQLFGEPVWVGRADHLDVLGYFRDRRHKEHRDWLSSGARFDRKRFDRMLDAVVEGMLVGEKGEAAA